MQKKYDKISVFSFISALVISPAIVLAATFLIKGKSYYLAAVLMIICAVFPFFLIFEKKKSSTGEIVIIALMTALAVASRGAMMFLPQVKPTCAIVIITAIALGPGAGFLTGALSIFLSNFMFGQGMFTPFQMLGMGLTGFICGAIFYNKKIAENRYAVSITGGLLCFIVYGFIVDSCSVLMLSTSITLKSALAFYSSGIAFNVIHAVTTGILLFLINKPMLQKFRRLKTKYGICR